MLENRVEEVSKIMQKFYPKQCKKNKKSKTLFFGFILEF